MQVLSGRNASEGPCRAMQLTILEDDPSQPEVAALLKAHLGHSVQHSPPGSMHALDVEALRSPGITFWTARSGPVVLGCGALKELDSHHGEIKSMHTAEASRGRGIGARILAHIVDEARQRHYRRLSLETGSMAEFAPARALYARFGFRDCEPFASYREDPNSTFMTLDLMI